MDAIANYYSSKLRTAAGRYREARRSLHAPASAQSRRGLDWMNFFIADVQTGFGSFVAFYLAQLGWSPAHIGLALSVGGVAGMLSQIPGGALADAVTWKRGLAAAGIIMTGAAALILAFAPDTMSVFIAQVLQGTTGGIITPAIGAISLGLVGRSAMAVLWSWMRVKFGPDGDPLPSESLNWNSSAAGPATYSGWRVRGGGLCPPR